MASAAILAVVHGSHEDTSATLRCWALPPQTLDLPISIDLVVLEDSQLGLLPLVLNLLWGGVHLLLALLGHTSAETEHEVEGGLLLDVVVRERATILELLAGEDKTLLVRGNPFLVLNFGHHIVNGIGRLYLKGNSLAREGLDEDLHGGVFIDLEHKSLSLRERCLKKEASLGQMRT